MININEMTDEQKSVILARLCSRYKQGRGLYEVLWYFDNGYFPIREPNIYDPSNMALAWLVLNWAHDLHDFYMWFYSYDTELGDELEWTALPPTEAQRLWLDKVLELAIEAGMVTAVTPNEETQ